MIVHHFPRPCPPAGWPNLVIHSRGSGIEYAEHEAPLSIKCVLQGQEVHEVRGIPYVVDEETYLLLNHGQRYASRIGSDQEVETLSIFFSREFAEQTLRSFVEPAERLLDEPDGDGRQPVRFVESLYPRDAVLSRLLEEISQWSNNDRSDESWLDERLWALLGRLLSLHTDLLRHIDALPAVRQSTRFEQYRRLRRARDFIDTNLAGELSLAEIARIACLSPYHLLRLFKEAFGMTPHQYSTRKRLDHARTLLERTDLPVSVICDRVGYRSLGSFSRLFSRHFGASPKKLRCAGPLRLDRLTSPRGLNSAQPSKIR